MKPIKSSPIPRFSYQSQSSSQSQQQLPLQVPPFQIMSNNSRLGGNRYTYVLPNKICHYLLKEEIGFGAFSTVKMAIHDTTNKQYACKIITKTRIIKAKMAERFESEVRILQKFNHPDIVHLYDLYQDSLNYYLICELFPFGTLYDFVVQNRKVVGQAAKYIFKQIVLTLDYIHKQGIAHRDVKPDNILINPATLQIKFIDFGLSAHFQEGTLMNTICGSPNYASPECISGKPYDGFKSDIWSLGVVLYMLVTGTIPWTKKVLPQLLSEIKESSFFVPITVESTCRDLILRLMNPTPEKRLSIPEILQHPFLQGVDFKPPPEPVENEIPRIDEEKLDYFFGKTLHQISHYHSDLPEAKVLLKRANRKLIMAPLIKKANLNLL